MLEEEIPDAVLLDLRLEDLHGTAWLRERQRLGLRTPVIIVTGYPDDLSPNEATRLDAHGPYVKPYHYGVLTDKVVTLVSAHRATGPAVVQDLVDLVDRLCRSPRPSDWVADKMAVLAALVRTLRTPALEVRLVAACARGLKKVNKAPARGFPRAIGDLRTSLAKATVPRSQLEPRLVRLLDLIESEEPRIFQIDRSDVASLLHLSETGTSFKLTNHLGVRLPELRRSRRVRDILPALLSTDCPIGNLAIDCGFLEAGSGFQHLMKDTFGLSATDLRALAQTVLATAR